jgi:hypothetical protein
VLQNKKLMVKLTRGENSYQDSVIDICNAFVSANIPFSKLGQSTLKQFT